MGTSLLFVVLVIKSCESLAAQRSVAHQAPLSMEFPGQEYWSGLPYPPPGALPNPGIEPVFPAFGILCHWATWEAQEHHYFR